MKKFTLPEIIFDWFEVTDVLTVSEETEETTESGKDIEMPEIDF